MDNMWKRFNSWNTRKIFYTNFTIIHIVNRKSIKIKTPYNDKNINKYIGIIGMIIQTIPIAQIIICHL